MNTLISGGCERRNNGQFNRLHNKWSLDNFNDGYIDAKGRFRVYFPENERANKKFGYVMRSIVAYEAYNNIKVTIEFDIHHKNKNRLDDSKENLELIEHKEHSKIHNPKKELIKRICKNCNVEFLIKQERLNSGKTRGSFCSHSCYYKYPKSKKTRLKQSKSLKAAYANGRR